MNAVNPQALASRIHRLYLRIAQLEDLSVNEKTLGLFGSLLDILREHSDSNLLAKDPYLQAIAPPLRRMFSRAAYAYEKYWAEKLLSLSGLSVVLRDQYPYYKHYERATHLEFQALVACLEKPLHRVLMVGSGPLPTTSIQLAKCADEQLSIDNLDINDDASFTGKRICEALGLTHRMNFVTSDILEKSDLAQYDAIWLAALAGDSLNKARLIEHLFLSMRPGALLLVRTACGLRGLLYPDVSTIDLIPFVLRLKIKTYSDNFHSIYLVQR